MYERNPVPVDGDEVLDIPEQDADIFDGLQQSGDRFEEVGPSQFVPECSEMANNNITSAGFLPTAKHLHICLATTWGQRRRGASRSSKVKEGQRWDQIAKRISQV